MNESFNNNDMSRLVAAQQAQTEQRQEQAVPIKKSSRSIGHYIIGKNIGEGTFGKVKLGTHILTGEKVAVKILEKRKIVEEADVQRVSREIEILKMMRHPNIIQLFEIIETPKQLFLIMEYVSGGELFDYIVKKQKLKEEEACKFFQQIISSIEYLHELGIVHRDLKPENLLLDYQNNLKLVDFGLSNTYKQGETLKTACGSPCYAAPEMIEGKLYYGSRVDIWSSGVILFAMVAGYLPFEDKDTGKLYQKILSGQFQMPKRLSDDCQDLLSKVMEIDPDRRLTVESIKRHNWYRKTNPTVYEAQGLIIGKNEIPIEPSMLSHLEKFGFKAEFATQCLNRNKHNQVTTVYYLLHNKFEKEGKLKTGFKVESTPQKESGSKKMDISAGAKQLSFQESVGPTAQGGGQTPSKSPEKRNRRQSSDVFQDRSNIKQARKRPQRREQLESDDNPKYLNQNLQSEFSNMQDIQLQKIDGSMGEGISPQKQRKKSKEKAPSKPEPRQKQDQEREKAKRILKNFDFDKLFLQKQRVDRNAQSEVRPKTAVIQTKATTEQARRRSQIEASNAITDSVQRQAPNLCDKCGSPTNIRKEWPSVQNERLQSAPAYRMREKQHNPHQTPQMPHQPRFHRYENESFIGTAYPYNSIHPLANMVAEQSYLANITQIPRWEDSFLNSTTPVYLNNSQIPVQGARVPYNGGMQTNGPHSYNINFHLNTAAPPDRRVDLIYPQPNDYNQIGSFYTTQDRNFLQTSLPMTKLEGRSAYNTSQSVRKQSILRQIQRESKRQRQEMSREISNNPRLSISNYRKKILIQNVNSQTRVSALNLSDYKPIISPATGERPGVQQKKQYIQIDDYNQVIKDQSLDVNITNMKLQTRNRQAN